MASKDLDEQLGGEIFDYLSDNNADFLHNGSNY